MQKLEKIYSIIKKYMSYWVIQFQQILNFMLRFAFQISVAYPISVVFYVYPELIAQRTTERPPY